MPKPLRATHGYVNHPSRRADGVNLLDEGSVANSGIIAERYATAIFELANDAKALDSIANDLNDLGRMLTDSGDLSHFIYSALPSRTEQLKAVASIAAQAQLQDITTRFLGVLAENRRLNILPEVTAAYKMRLAKLRDEKTAEVTSAQPLAMAQVEALKSKLQQTLGGKVHLDLKIDPEILGGLIVKVGSKLIDSSVKGKLDRLEILMKGTV